MTKKQLTSTKWALKNDPSYIINFILDNNLPAVIENFISAGYNGVTDKDEAIEAINDILQDLDGGVDRVIEILSVSMDPENMPSGLQDIVLDVAKTNISKVSTAPNTTDSLQLKSLAGWGEQGIGLDNIFGALAGGLNGLLAGGNTAINGTTGQYGQYPQNYYGQNWTGQKNNSMVWIIVGIIALIVVAYLLFFRKKG